MLNYKRLIKKCYYKTLPQLLDYYNATKQFDKLDETSDEIRSNFGKHTIGKNYKYERFAYDKEQIRFLKEFPELYSEYYTQFCENKNASKYGGFVLKYSEDKLEILQYGYMKHIFTCLSNDTSLKDLSKKYNINRLAELIKLSEIYKPTITILEIKIEKEDNVETPKSNNSEPIECVIVYDSNTTDSVDSEHVRDEYDFDSEPKPKTAKLCRTYSIAKNNKLIDMLENREIDEFDLILMSTLANETTAPSKKFIDFVKQYVSSERYLKIGDVEFDKFKLGFLEVARTNPYNLYFKTDELHWNYSVHNLSLVQQYKSEYFKITKNLEVFENQAALLRKELSVMFADLKTVSAIKVSKKMKVELEFIPEELVNKLFSKDSISVEDILSILTKYPNSNECNFLEGIQINFSGTNIFECTFDAGKMYVLQHLLLSNLTETRLSQLTEKRLNQF